MNNNRKEIIIAYDLFFGVFIRDEQIDGLFVPEVDVVAEQEYKQQFAYIFLLLIPIQSLIA